MKRRLSSAPAGGCVCLRVHAEKRMRRSGDAAVALSLFIRGSENYLLTRRLNKRGAINRNKQL